MTSTAERHNPNDTNQCLRRAHSNPKGTRLFLYDLNGPYEDSSSIDVNVEVSASVLLQCVDSNPRFTLQPRRRTIWAYVRSQTPRPAVGDVKAQQIGGKAGVKPGNSTATKSFAADDERQCEQSDVSAVVKENATLRTLSMLNDTVFTDDTPCNESSMTISIKGLIDEVNRDKEISTTNLESLERPSIIPSQRKPSTEVKRDSQLTETIISSKTACPTPNSVARSAPPMLYAQNRDQRVFPKVGSSTLNMSNSSMEQPTTARKNSHKTLWQRLFKRNSKSASKDSEELSKVHSKSRTFRSTSPSLEVVTQKTLTSYKTQSNSTWNAKPNGLSTPPEPFEIAHTEMPHLEEEVVHMVSKGNQTDFPPIKGKSSKTNKNRAPPESSQLFTRHSSSKEAPMSFINPKEGNKQNSIEVSTLNSGKLKRKTSKVISVEVSNSSMASADNDLVCFVQVAKSLSMENTPPTSSKATQEEKGTCSTQKTILTTGQVEECEGTREGSSKRAEFRRANLEIRAPCMSTITPPTNCVDTTDEDDPFASDHFSNVFSAKDSLDLCTWVEKPAHFRIAENNPILRKTEPVSAAGSIPPLLLDETGGPNKLHPKDSLDMYVLDDVDPVKRKPFKNEVRFLLRRKKSKSIQKEKKVPAIDGHRVFPQPQQHLHGKMDFVDAVEELEAQFQLLKRQNSNILANRAVLEGNKLNEEDDNATEINFYTENDDSLLLDQSRPASEPPLDLAPHLHGQQDVVNEELTSFPKVRVFVTSPDSLTHTPIEESSDNSPPVDQTPPTDGPPQFVILSPYCTDVSNHPSVIESIPTIPVNGTNLGSFCCVLPNQSEKQHQSFNSNPNLAFYSLQCGSVMAETHPHSPNLPQQILLLNPIEASSGSPAPTQSPPGCNYLNPGIQFEYPQCRHIDSCSYTDSDEYALSMHHGKIQTGSPNSPPKAMGCTQCDLTTNNQKCLEISHHHLDKAEEPHLIHTHAYPFENSRSPGDIAVRTNYLEHNFGTTNLRCEQTLPPFALKAKMSSTTASTNGSEAVLMNDNQMENPGECSRQASSSSEKGSSTEIEVVDVDDEANFGSPDRYEVDQTGMVIEKISHSLVSFLKLHSTTKHPHYETSTEKKVPDREMVNYAPSITQNMRCNAQADYEVSISVGGNSQADLKVHLESMALPQEDKKGDHSIATPPPSHDTKRSTTGEVEQPRSVEEDTLWIRSSKSIADSEAQSETLKMNVSTISEGEFDKPGIDTGVPKSNQVHHDPVDKNSDGKEDSPAPDTEALEIPPNVATNRNSCDIFNRDGLFLTMDSRQRESGEQSDISEFQNVMVTLKDSPSAPPSSTFKALNVEVKANPAWLCQGMFVRAVKIRNGSRCTEERSRAGKNKGGSPAQLIYRGEIRNQSIPSITINHSDHADFRKAKDGQFILDRSVDVLQPPGNKQEGSDAIDRLSFIRAEEQRADIHGTTTRMMRQDSSFIQGEIDNSFGTYLESTLQKTPESSGKGAHSKNGRNNDAKLDKARRQNCVKSKDLLKALEMKEDIEEIRPKPRRVVSVPASNTLDGGGKGNAPQANTQEMPALIFVPGTRLPTELMKLCDSKVDPSNGWCIMPLPVYRTQHALYAAYAQNFPGFKV
ncbi:unnamed protein product [Hydatigera taeniaeformis]|uniref:BAH domain-containing protein n=1 Tax=Hydatigena taeniaeformis TaxID=6205 RepID=A0A0R3WIE9_HYDTA|nr:unnamed protein product [Hydatigera taeniaeformis]